MPITDTHPQETRHTDDMQDIIKAVPSWIVRWGITVLFFIVLMVVGFAFLVHYPDTIKTQIKIASTEAPLPVLANGIGRLESVLIADNQMIKAGQPLGYLDAGPGQVALKAGKAGQAILSPLLQVGSNVQLGQPVFYIRLKDQQFYGEIAVAEGSIRKVKVGQSVLIKLKSFPFEEYGLIKGRISYVADMPYRDSIYIARVAFKIDKTRDSRKIIRLKEGLSGEADIITQDVSVVQRIFKSLTAVLNR